MLAIDSEKAQTSFLDVLSLKGLFKNLVDLSCKHALGLSLIT